MKLIVKCIGIFCLMLFSLNSSGQNYAFQFYDNTFNFTTDDSFEIPFRDSLSKENITDFYQKVNSGNYGNVVNTLLNYKNQHQLNDWFYYQLVRKAVQQFSPKEENYERYTLYKWFLMAKSGYDVRLALSKNNSELLFYVWSDDDISEVPFYKIDGRQYVCLNIHDYIHADYKTDALFPVQILLREEQRPFSYKVTQIPDFKPDDYREKLVKFKYGQKEYYFELKLNPEMQAMFKNYPVVNYDAYFNIPLSKETYQSLIPILKKNVSKMTQKKGVDYLMRFTRNAFLYEDDAEQFGKEKRFSPEQTLFNEYSDCDDRAALFFYLVREIYDLPMIALLYPTHITMAVKFDKPVGQFIEYKGEKYSICEPTPQKTDLKIGELASNLQDEDFQVVYHYQPGENSN